MARTSRTPYPAFPRHLWPAEDQRLFRQIQGDGDPFSENTARRSDRNARTWKWLEYSYRAWLGFLHQHQPELLRLRPELRATPETVDQFVQCLRKTSSGITISIHLQRLFLIVRDMAPQADLRWLWIASRRISKSAKKRPRQHVPARMLFAAGTRLMQRAVDFGSISESTAITYRKGLEIAFATLIPERRRCLESIRLGEHLVKSGPVWKLKLPPELTKSKKEATYTLPERFSPWIDDYVERFRPALPGAADHNGLWAALSGKPMHRNTIYQSLTRSTKAELGIAVSPHGFRRSVATDWHQLGPEHTSKAQQMLDHSSADTTLEHYVVEDQRTVGHSLTDALASYVAPSGEPSRVIFDEQPEHRECDHVPAGAVAP